MRFVPVIYIFGWLLAILSAFTLIPAAIALNFSESKALTAFVVSGFAMAFLGGVVILSLRGRVDVISRGQSLMLFGIFWIFMPGFACMPIFMSGSAETWTRAFFETVSGLTTTGATIFPDMTELPRSILAWRSLLQWLGGLLTLLGLAFFYGSARQKSFQDTNLRLGRGTRSGGNWFSVAAMNVILPLYCSLTAICFTLLVVTGIPAFDAFCIAMSTVSTGGFMPINGTLQTYGAILALPVMIIFMYFGAVSVFWVGRLFFMEKRDVDLQREPWWIAAFILALGFLCAFQLITSAPISGPINVLQSSLYGLATATSLITTSGFVFTERLADAVPLIVLLAICFVGGGRMSTAGGLKFHRMGAMLHHSEQELHRLIYPHSILSDDISTKHVGGDAMRTIWVNFSIILMVMAMSVAVLSTAGLSLQAALLASISALSNIGPAYDLLAVTGDVTRPPFGELETFAQITLSFVMIAGRIEILALLSLFNFAYWQN